MMMGERVKDLLRKAEQEQMIRTVRGPRKLRLALILKNLLAIFTNRRVDEPRRQYPSTAASPTWRRS